MKVTGPNKAAVQTGDATLMDGDVTLMVPISGALGPGLYTVAWHALSTKEKIEGHIVPLLIRLIGVRLFVKLMISQGLKQIPKEQGAWVANLIASTWGEADAKSIALAWREAMAFDSRARLKEIKCPTLVIAGSDDNAVPMHHAKMLHDGIAGSKLVVIEGADHALIWAHPDQWLEKVNEFLDS